MKTYEIKTPTETSSTVFQQIRKICRDNKIPHKDPWDRFKKTLSVAYSKKVELDLVDDCNLLKCKLCGHAGCGKLWKAYKPDDINTYMLTDDIQLVLPPYIICGSECINIPIKIANLLAKMKSIGLECNIVDGRIQIDSWRNIGRHLEIWLPYGLVDYTWDWNGNKELWCTPGKWKWRPSHVLEMPRATRRHWHVHTATRPSINVWYDYIVRIKI